MSEVAVKRNSARSEATSSCAVVKADLKAKVKMRSRVMYERDFRNACDGLTAESWKPEKRGLTLGIHLFQFQTRLCANSAVNCLFGLVL
jgi:hypothetical protein